MVTSDDILTKDGEEEEPIGQAEASLEVAEITGNIEVSLNSMVGLSPPKTMKVKGYIREQPAVTLIDSGATHNFISRDLVSKLSLPKEKTSSYGITLGSGDSVAEEGICCGVRLRLQGIDIVANILPLKLGSQ